MPPGCPTPQQSMSGLDLEELAEIGTLCSLPAPSQEEIGGFLSGALCPFLFCFFFKIYLYTTTGKTIALTRRTFVGKVMSLLLPPGDIPDPGIKPKSLMSPALAGRFFTTSATRVPPGKPLQDCWEGTNTDSLPATLKSRTTRRVPPRGTPRVPGPLRLSHLHRIPRLSEAPWEVP